ERDTFKRLETTLARSRKGPGLVRVVDRRLLRHPLRYRPAHGRHGLGPTSVPAHVGGFHSARGAGDSGAAVHPMALFLEELSPVLIWGRLSRHARSAGL